MREAAVAASPGVKHVPLASIDGMHAVDFPNVQQRRLNLASLNPCNCR